MCMGWFILLPVQPVLEIADTLAAYEDVIIVAVFQFYLQPAVEVGMYAAYGLYMGYIAAVDTKEYLRVQYFLQFVQRFIYDVFLLLHGVQEDDLVIGTHIGHIGYGYIAQPVALLYQEARLMRCAALLQLLQQAGEIGGDVILLQPPVFIEGGFQLFFVYGFQQVVYAVQLEGAEGISIVGGGKDDGNLHLHLFKYLET